MFWRYGKIVVWIALSILLLYGLGRLYYKVTGGFMVGNISYELPYDPRFDTHSLSLIEKEQIGKILEQNFYYLGKGCQSYVFASEDGQYVIKFFKYQRFRPQFWLNYLTFIPGVDSYLLQKVEKKRQKLESVFTSWKIAYEHLQKETGVVFIHLNKSSHLKAPLHIYDKMGFLHVLSSDNFEFLIQKKAKMICANLKEMRSKGKLEERRKIIDNLLNMFVDEYRRGFADNDHALMQNTGVLNGYPIHIDVGQFVTNKKVQNPEIYHQEIFNKTWKFRKWLEKEDPELATYLVSRLKDILGEKEFASFKPRLNKASMGIISQEEGIFSLNHL